MADPLRIHRFGGASVECCFRWQIKLDARRVCVIERTNLRYLSGLPQKVDLVTLDLSFISILLVGRGGIVKDPQVHQEVLEKIINGVETFGFHTSGWIESPLKGADGNKEFLVHFNRMIEKLVGRSRKQSDMMVQMTVKIAASLFICNQEEPGVNARHGRCTAVG
ncbi:hypothetical protein Dimus_016925 [Dionaea muscipula]